MNLGDSLNMMTGLTSSAYNSILGNSLSQNILGSQISNSFGKKSEVFIDGIRLLEKIKVDKDTNLIDFEPTGKSRALETAQWFASLGGYVGDRGRCPDFGPAEGVVGLALCRCGGFQPSGRGPADRDHLEQLYHRPEEMARDHGGV